MPVSAGALRYMRKRREGGSGVLTARQRQEARVSTAPDTMMYDDLGMILTEEDYGNITGAMQASADVRAQAKAEMEAAQAQLNAAIQANKQSVDQLWADYDKDFVEVHVYKPGEGPEDMTHEDTYRLPKEVIDQLDAKAFKPGYQSGGWEEVPDTGSQVYTVKPVWEPGGGDADGMWSQRYNQYNEILADSEKQLKNEYYMQVAPQVHELNQQLERQRRESQGLIDKNRYAIQSAEEADKALLERWKNKQAEQTATATQASYKLTRG